MNAEAAMLLKRSLFSATAYEKVTSLVYHCVLLLYVLVYLKLILISAIVARRVCRHTRLNCLTLEWQTTVILIALIAESVSLFEVLPRFTTAATPQTPPAPPKTCYVSSDIRID